MEAALATTAWAGVVHLGSLDVVAHATATGAAVVAEQARGCGSVLRVVQALARGTTPAARVWVATQGAQAVTAGAAVAVAQAPAWGLGRVIALGASGAVGRGGGPGSGGVAGGRRARRWRRRCSLRTARIRSRCAGDPIRGAADAAPGARDPVVR